MSEIRTGVEHLHNQGLTHNDLNPSNIAIDKLGNPIILDFGSCQKFGEQLISAGTPGWDPKQDKFAIEKFAVWIKDNARV